MSMTPEERKAALDKLASLSEEFGGYRELDDAPATLRSFPVWVTLTAGADEACATLRLNVHARDAKGAIEAVRRALGETS